MTASATDGLTSNDYHHGQLRQTLVDTAARMVATQGLGALSLRAVAREARVSHNAPYHHFKSKADLLAEVAADGFAGLLATIEQHISQYAADDAMGRLLAVGTGYLEFALANPSLFRLMFRPELTNPSEHPKLKAAEANAFNALVNVLLECQAKNLVSSDWVHSLALSCWSTVHGLAILWLDHVVEETPLKDLPYDQLAREVQARLVASLALKLSSK